MKTISKAGLPIFILTFLFASCDISNSNDDSERVRTGRVTFFNESSYRVNVRRDAFSGPIVVELGSGETRTVDVRISDGHGLGTTFSIEYFYLVTDGFDPDSGDIFASGHDFNVQINRVIEENRSITIQIPQPMALEFRTAFIRVLNTHNLPGTLFHFGQSIPQAGNGVLPIAPGRTGIYRLNDLAMGGIPTGGEFEFTGLSVNSGFGNITPIPAFTARNGVIYSFTYSGGSVTRTGEQTIIFR